MQSTAGLLYKRKSNYLLINMASERQSSHNPKDKKTQKTRKLGKLHFALQLMKEFCPARSSKATRGSKVHHYDEEFHLIEKSNRTRTQFAHWMTTS